MTLVDWFLLGVIGAIFVWITGKESSIPLLHRIGMAVVITSLGPIGTAVILYELWNELNS